MRGADREAPRDVGVHGRGRALWYTRGMDVDQLLREALRLPPAARAKLVGELLYSLDDSPPDADRDAAWASEIRRRLDAYDAGKARASARSA